MRVAIGPVGGWYAHGSKHLRQRAFASLALAAALVLSQVASADSRGGDVAATEAQWLTAARTAAQRVNYSGTIVYQAGGEIRSSRITHLFDGTRSLERIQTLDGRPREYLRKRSDSDDEVRCLIPESKKVVVEKRSVEESFPSLAGTSPDEILQRYDVRVGEVERVAGREARLVSLEPRDRMRYAYRLWLDRATGLLLRAQTINGRSEVIEQIAFSNVRIGEPVDRSDLKPSWSTEGWSVVSSEYRPTELASHGWVVPTPDGFRKTKEVMRRLHKADAMQVVFTDGLATISVFVEPGSAVTDPPAAVRVHGPTAAFARRVGNALVTAVGEVPPGTIRDVALSVEFRGAR